MTRGDPPLVFRSARSEDMPHILSASAQTGWGQLSARERAGVTQEEFAARVSAMFQQVLSAPGGTLLVAEEDGRVIGYILYCLQPNALTGRLEGFFFDQFVEPDRRHRGLAQGLNARAMEHCARLGAAGVSLLIAPHNADSQKAARRSGFEVERLIFARPL
ncbi:MAG: N-acetyltransferase family protein [Bacillota bacterium]